MTFLQFIMVWLPFVVLSFTHHLGEAAVVRFDEEFIVKYGDNHVSKRYGGIEAQLSLDRASGSAFMSKKRYASGFFQMKIKLPTQHSPGLVSTFYLTSNRQKESGDHDEIDFEFLGTDGPPFILQTNIFADDNGGREQRLRLWFDPTKNFHTYGILWNPAQIVFFVDKVPIRVFKNNKRFGVRYPSKPMTLEGSIWNGEAWASGGKKIDWSKSPFQLLYSDFNIQGCEFGNKCYSNTFWWNRRQHWHLTRQQQSIYESIKKKYVYYSYCSDRGKFFNECKLK